MIDYEQAVRLTPLVVPDAGSPLLCPSLRLSYLLCDAVPTFFYSMMKIELFAATRSSFVASFPTWFVSEEGSSQVDEKTKEEYEEKARVDKERYLKEKAESVSKNVCFLS